MQPNTTQPTQPKAFAPGARVIIRDEDWMVRGAMPTSTGGTAARVTGLSELDALAALSLDMTLDELLRIYSVQFPVLQQYERETVYEQRGKIVFTVNKGLSGVGLDRKEWELVRDAKAGDALHDWAHDQQGPFVPPFDGCDREQDVARAYEHFRDAARREKR